MDIETKLSEAEAYSTHGLYRESLDIFQEVLETAPDLTDETKKKLSEKIKYLENVIEDIDQDDQQAALTSQDISLIRGGGIAESPPEIIDGALAFRELGMYNEAILEYEKLFDLEYPKTDVVLQISECLFETLPPSRIIDRIQQIITEKKFSDKEKTDVQYKLGQEMQKKDHKDLALELFESVRNENPEFFGIHTKIESLVDSVSYKSKYDYLLKRQIVEPPQLQKALALSKQSNKSVETVLIETLKIKKEDVGKSLSLFFKCSFINYSEEMEVPSNILGKLKKQFLLQNTWVPLSFDTDAKKYTVLVDDPTDLVKTDNIQALLNSRNVAYSVALKEDILKIITLFFKKSGEFKATQPTAQNVGDISTFKFDDVNYEEVDDEVTLDDVQDVNENSNEVVKFVDQALFTAYQKGASDIHFEPSSLSNQTMLRYRIDGVCQEVMRIPNSQVKAILSRIKIMAGLDIAERRLPQDGKIKFKRKGLPDFELRVATLPTVGGNEDAVLRILAKSGAMKIDNMGIKQRNLDVLKKIISQPYGLILVVGPTGSGKTTTLHSALGHINKPEVKIWTAEDPVEITQEGLRQVQCQAKIGLDFSRVLRAFLRADPDIIMIGEMRDNETASIGVEASLTGHLVFSTLHTNSAPETVTRLLDMGLNPLNFSDAFLGVLAQRLTRRLCKSCKEEYHPSQDEFDDIITLYGEKYLKSTGIEYTDDLTIFKGVGCEVCNGSGYKGRLGIHELMEGTKEIKMLIKKEATTQEILQHALFEGMSTLVQDGILKAFDGDTDIAEVRRVCVS